MGKARGGPGGHGGHWRLVVGAVLLVVGLAPQPAGARGHGPRVQAPARAGAASGSWSLTRSMATARAFYTLTLLPSGQVLAVGGGAGDGSSTASVELYNARRGTWTATGSLLFPRQSHTATLLRSGQVLVTGGSQANGALSSAELYHAATGRFTYTLGNMAIQRVYQTATLLRSGQVLVTGGCVGELFACDATWSSADLYDPTTQTFTATGTMTQARQFHTATLLPSGQVLVAGGAGCVGCLATNEADLYDPASGTFRPNLGLMAAPRALHTATVLQNGLVLLAGGCTAVGGTYCPNGTALASAELYDPATHTFTATGSMSTPRYGHTATLLPDGEVLVAGGIAACSRGGLCPALSSAELYDPVTGTWTLTAPMQVARVFAATTALPGGGVLVAGGCPGEYSSGACRGNLASAEIYQ